MRDGHVPAVCVAALLPLHCVLWHINARAGASGAKTFLSVNGKKVTEYGIAKGRWLRPDHSYVYHYTGKAGAGGAGGTQKGKAKGSGGSGGGDEAGGGAGGSSSSGSVSNGEKEEEVVRQRPDRHCWLYFK